MLKQINERASSRVRYKGLTAFEEGESFVAIKEIPGVVEAGWRPHAPIVSLPEPVIDKATYSWMRGVCFTGAVVYLSICPPSAVTGS